MQADPGQRAHRAAPAEPAPWARETARLPVAFAQVREDAALDQHVADRLPAGAQVLLVASGGCTAAALAARPQVARLHLIDPNPAQMALTRLKLRLLATAGTDERVSLLGHAPMPVAARQLRLAVELEALDLPMDALGPVDLLARLGPDHAGRYEILFLQLREALGHARPEIEVALELRDPAEQSRRLDPKTAPGRALDEAFDAVMAQANLVELFGEAATRNRVEPFARHFARRTRHALATFPAAENPYLWQMLAGRFPNGQLSPWLGAASPARMPAVGWTVTTMAEALPRFAESFDFIHLSNILDWLAPDEARATLDLAWTALRPGGWVFIRQLNSSLNIPTLGSRFAWDGAGARELHARDRSFFYRSLHLGRKG